MAKCGHVGYIGVIGWRVVGNCNGEKLHILGALILRVLFFTILGQTFGDFLGGAKFHNFSANFLGIFGSANFLGCFDGPNFTILVQVFHT